MPDDDPAKKPEDKSADKGADKPTVILQDSGRVPVERLNSVIAERDEARAKAAALEQKDAELATTKARLAQVETRANQERALFALAFEHPALRMPTVRQRIIREFEQAHADVAPDKRPAFDEWVKTLKDDPFWAPHFAAADTADKDKDKGGAGGDDDQDAAGKKKDPPDLNRGTRDDDARAATEESIRRALASGQYARYRDQDLAAAIAAGEILPPKKKTD